MFNPFAKEIENIESSPVHYDFLIKSFEKSDLQEFIRNRDLDSVGKTEYLDGILNEIKNEKESLLNDIEHFCTKKEIINDLSNSGATINSLFEIIQFKLIRLQRFNLILNPTIYQFNLKSGDKIYDKSSAVWINDNGLKNKNFSRNFGNQEENIVNVLEKTLIKYMGATTVKNVQHPQYMPDLAMKFGTEIFYFEVTRMEKSSIIKTATILEMWKHYKEIYNL